MSRIRKQMEITPPQYVHGTKLKEVLYSNKHTCPYCHGNGWFWTDSDSRGEREKKDCTICKGCGTLDAEVTIEWKPSKEPDEICWAQG